MKKEKNKRSKIIGEAFILNKWRGIELLDSSQLNKTNIVRVIWRDDKNRRVTSFVSPYNIKIYSDNFHNKLLKKLKTIIPVLLILSGIISFIFSILIVFFNVHIPIYILSIVVLVIILLIFGGIFVDKKQFQISKLQNNNSYKL